jgi:hypothetical protein
MRTLFTLAVFCCFAVSVSAQEAMHSMSDTHRDAQMRQLGAQRSLLVAMADSMPESLYRDRATPEQRDFAQQVHHAASAVVFIAARYFSAEPPQQPDTAATFNTREGLKTFINTAYDFAGDVLKKQSMESRMEVVNFFGQMDIPRWQIWDEIHQHSMWTAGQLVANFRKNGMAPPAFAFF